MHVKWNLVFTEKEKKNTYYKILRVNKLQNSEVKSQLPASWMQAQYQNTTARIVRVSYLLQIQPILKTNILSKNEHPCNSTPIEQESATIRF